MILSAPLAAHFSCRAILDVFSNSPSLRVAVAGAFRLLAQGPVRPPRPLLSGRLDQPPELLELLLPGRGRPRSTLPGLCCSLMRARELQPRAASSHPRQQSVRLSSLPIIPVLLNDREPSRRCYSAPHGPHSKHAARHSAGQPRGEHLSWAARTLPAPARRQRPRI